ncbi:ATP-dependent zinc metalloprotease FTSH 9, chloroplastic-like [Lycium barbarum]|uniref:ATP-dependent zinc metalloprotease FTSH 9, chloroplastic-like n=1 Tax=Lycium barbarum TaxID=112863 RepID=UPI00293E8B12|nr:ATP-dependent zinc metalloprotease FTSH 9, chloroplastic-like [Lycium barbarum]
MEHLLRPVIHVQISLNFQYYNNNNNNNNTNPNYFYKHNTFFSSRYGFLHQKKPISLNFPPNSLNGFQFWGKNRKNRVGSTGKPEFSAADSKKCSGSEPGRGFEFWGKSSSRKRIIVRANGSGCEQDSDSTEKTETSATDSKKNPGQEPGRVKNSGRKEKQGKDKWWWWWSKGKKLRWEPIVQAQEIGVLLLQLGIVMFVMRLLRPGLPLPGSDPRAPTMFVSVPYSEFLSKISSNKVEKVEVDGVHIMFKLKNSEVSSSSSSSSVIENNNEVVNGNGNSIKLQDSEVLLLRSVSPTKKIVYTTTRPSDIKTPYEKMLENDVEFGSPDKRSGGFLNSALIALFYVAVLAGLLHRFPVNFSQSTAGQLRNRKSGGSGGAKVSELGETITFDDVAGVDEAKEELEEIVEFLRNPDKYVRLGARPPRGVLLVGLPGTGKTLLAKAVAGEAEVPFISCSASEFVELYVGMGASRVRDLFARAKKEAPSIIFIDEIDAVAKSRDGKFRIVSNDEREQTLNQLLTEMDGFDSNSAVIVLGATNRSDVLDPALRRPGRFDRVVMVEAPDRIGREAILKVHVSKKELPLAQDVNLGNIASMTTGFTGADLANLVNEAALLAGRLNKVVVEKDDFIQAVERSIAGIEKKTAKLQGSEKGVVARHEAGHAVVGTAVANLLGGQQPRVEKLSILPRSGGALGFTYIPPTTEDRYLLFVDELRGRLVTLLGGRAAEEVLYSGRVSTGAFDDIRRATDMAYKAVAEYGLSDTIGPISVATLSSGGMDDGGSMPWGNDQGHLVDLVQREVKALLQSALDIALCVVRANLKVLEGLGAQLEEQEKVEGEVLQEWLSLVVAPAELNFFVKGKQGSLLPLQAGS